MPPGIGYSFQPGAQNNGAPQRRPQESVRTLSLNLPKSALGGSAPTSRQAMQAPGGQGMPSSVLARILQALMGGGAPGGGGFGAPGGGFGSPGAPMGLGAGVGGPMTPRVAFGLRPPPTPSLGPNGGPDFVVPPGVSIPNERPYTPPPGNPTSRPGLPPGVFVPQERPYSGPPPPVTPPNWLDLVPGGGYGGSITRGGTRPLGPPHGGSGGYGG